MKATKFISWRPWRSSSNTDGLTVPTPPPYLLRYRSSTFFIVGTICVATFTDIFLYGLIVPVMPFALTTRAGIAEDQVQHWNTILVACYGIALFVASPIAGLYADHTSSRRTPLMGGLIALGASTVLLCLGRSIAVFIVGRILQGFSAGVVWSVGLALLADTMGRKIGLGMGYVSIALSAGLLCAPLVGGGVYASAGYYAVYYVAFGFIALDIIMRLFLIEKKTALQWLKEDTLAGTAGDAEAPPADDSGYNADPGLARPIPPEIGTLKRSAMLLRSKRLMANLVGCAINAGVFTAFDTVLPLFTEEVFHWKSTAAGLIFFTLFTPPLILSPPVGLLADRCGAKWPAVFGFALSVPLLVCLRFVDENSLHKKVLLCVLLSLLGVVLTFSQVPLMAEIGFVIETIEAANPGVWGSKGVYGIGYGLFNTAFALGSFLGSLMAGYIQDSFGWSTTTWVLGVWCSVGLVFVVVGAGEFQLRPPPKPKGPPTLARELLTKPTAEGEAAGTIGTAGATEIQQASSDSSPSTALVTASERTSPSA
ncbi:mfs amine [Ophiostoma piceae UAMH 11346]|uniref:Mfs amine n=1 Tax=Ophiostoma piceae (strain UAMH 11346) TaxID=1262450 RepID=S3CDX2_OPHP1|nr:mfs amine [Ophiostoma piceae UAMH 11346]